MVTVHADDVKLGSLYGIYNSNNTTITYFPHQCFTQVVVALTHRSTGTEI